MISYTVVKLPAKPLLYGVQCPDPSGYSQLLRPVSIYLIIKCQIFNLCNY